MALLIEHEPSNAIIENVFRDARLIDLKGEVKACFKLADVPLQHVAPRTWMKAMLGQTTSDKELSVRTCQQLAPSANINRPSPKGRTSNPDHNRAEATLLSLYLSRLVLP